MALDLVVMHADGLHARAVRRPGAVQIPTSRSLDLEDDYTLMAWINLNMINDGRILDKATAGKLDGYEFDVRRAGDGMGVLRYADASGISLLSRLLTFDVVSLSFKTVCGWRLLHGIEKAVAGHVVSRGRHV